MWKIQYFLILQGFFVFCFLEKEWIFQLKKCGNQEKSRGKWSFCRFFVWKLCNFDSALIFPQTFPCWKIENKQFFWRKNEFFHCCGFLFVHLLKSIAGQAFFVFFNCYSNEKTTAFEEVFHRCGKLCGKVEKSC